MPDQKLDPALTQNAMIGAAKRRVDGPLKVTGGARYAADHQPEGMVHAYGVYSSIAHGRITAIDAQAALAMPGVIDVIHHGNAAKLYRVPPGSGSDPAVSAMIDEHRPPFEDDRVYYAGQFVAVVVAQTFEQARAAAYAVKVDYAAEAAVADLAQALAKGEPKAAKGDHKRGDPAGAYDKAAKRVDATYTTPVETHNPMEMHATVAQWRGDHLHVYESTQGVVNHRNVLARMFGLAPDQVDVEAPFIGSGFGSKLWLWPHSAAACLAARHVGKPVQLVVPRMQMFTTTGHRPETKQHLRLATDDQGRLLSLRHESINSTSFVDEYVESCGGVSKSLYACDNVLVTHHTAQVHRGTPTSMRAPGAAPGLFALECAMDEMAEAVGIDPLAFRRLNHAETDGSQDLPWSSNHLLDAYDQAAERFGWDRRTPAPGSMREGEERIGWGVAACNWEAFRMATEARASLRDDGRVEIRAGVQDIGTGTYTVVAQTVAALTGLPLARIDVKLGDSSFPPGPVSGGSWATASVLPAVAEAVRAATEQLKAVATARGGPFEGSKPDELRLEDGQLTDGKRRVPFEQILREQKVAAAEAKSRSEPDTPKDKAFRSFGVHFVEVRWDPGISRLRVTRVVSAIDAGRVINAVTARNQVEGAIVMALGMAMFEATEYDARSALPVNNNYAEYVVPVHADQPDIDVILLDYPDYALNELGARGIGEIGTTGLAAAVANAVYHATGKRIRDLPITLEKLMDELPRAAA